MLLTSDLACLQRAEAVPRPDDLPEGLNCARRVESALARISAFATQRS